MNVYRRGEYFFPENGLLGKDILVGVKGREAMLLLSRLVDDLDLLLSNFRFSDPNVDCDPDRRMASGMFISSGIEAADVNTFLICESLEGTLLIFSSNLVNIFCPSFKSVVVVEVSAASSFELHSRQSIRNSENNGMG